ncbi:oligosaccharide flippase family protein [Patescibacteria group bacterium]|nr:oligosaccharide flippase family protein [Patescibacteria group bacterium]
MIKKSLANVSFVGIGNAINAALNFAFIIAVANSLDLDSFGRYALLTTLLVAISRLTDFGTNSVYVARSIIIGKKSLQDVFYTLKILLLLIAIPVSLVILIGFKFTDITLVILFLLGLVAYLVNYTLLALFQKAENFSKLVLTNLLPSIIKGILALLLFTNLITLNLNGAFAVFSLSVFSSALFILFLENNQKRFTFVPSKILPVLRQAYPAGISQLIQEGWPSLNTTITKITQDFADVGIFSLADKISRTFSIAAVSVFTVLLPKSARRKKENKGYDFKEIILLSVLLLVLATFSIVVVKFFMPIVFGNKFDESIALLGILIFAAAFTAIHTFIEHIFYVEEKTKYIVYINVGKLLLFLLLTTILIPTYSLYGLAISNLVAGIFGVAVTIFFVEFS